MKRRIGMAGRPVGESCYSQDHGDYGRGAGVEFGWYAPCGMELLREGFMADEERLKRYEWFSGTIGRLEAIGDEIERIATTPEQAKMAAALLRAIHEMGEELYPMLMTAAPEQARPLTTLQRLREAVGGRQLKEEPPKQPTPQRDMEMGR